jgi:hypothetical protein
MVLEGVTEAVAAKGKFNIADLQQKHLFDDLISRR